MKKVEELLLPPKWRCLLKCLTTTMQTFRQHLLIPRTYKTPKETEAIRNTNISNRDSFCNYLYFLLLCVYNVCEFMYGGHRTTFQDTSLSFCPEFWALNWDIRLTP